MDQLGSPEHKRPMLRGISFGRPHHGWMDCAFIRDDGSDVFDISDAVVDSLWLFANVVRALSRGQDSAPVELFLEPEWLHVTFISADSEVVIRNQDKVVQCIYQVRWDEYASFIAMALKRLRNECAKNPDPQDWSHPIPDLDDVSISH